MNTSNLHELIKRYYENYSFINNDDHNELFKLRALAKFRKEWFSEKNNGMSFADKFKLAMSESSILVNNSRVSPITGIVEMAKKCPEKVEQLFFETLFTDEEDVNAAQNKMDRFLEEIEKIRQMTFPRHYRYKQDRHAASCYMFFFNPSIYYIYRYTDAEEFSLRLEYGKDIGCGESFNLKYYYEMADIVVESLKEHPELIQGRKDFLGGDDCYLCDEDLHLMAFDLMYCCRCYNFYAGLKHKSKDESILDRELEEKIDALKEQIRALEIEMEPYQEISLLDVEVTQRDFGVGVVCKQEINKIVVQFESGEKAYTIINGSSFYRPRFEDDEEVVEAFTEYKKLADKKIILEQDLKKLIKQRK